MTTKLSQVQFPEPPNTRAEWCSGERRKSGHQERERKGGNMLDPPPCLLSTFFLKVLHAWGVGISSMPIHLHSGPNVLTYSQHNCPLHILIWASLSLLISPNPGAPTSHGNDPHTSLTSIEKKVRGELSEHLAASSFCSLAHNLFGLIGPSQRRTGAKTEGVQQRLSPQSLLPSGRTKFHYHPKREDFTPRAKATDSDPASSAFAYWVQTFGYRQMVPE